MKGIILAGGTGSRLWPLTKSTSKQLLPIYDKPLIYYPLSTLMLAGVNEILIITTPEHQEQFQSLLKNGKHLGISIEYEIQLEPRGLAESLIIGKKFLNNESCFLILGDNIFHGVGLGSQLSHELPIEGAQIFTYKMADPRAYGVVTLNENGLPTSITEKPEFPTSNLVITGLYFFDNSASTFAEAVLPSQRGELEITSVIEKYLEANLLSVKQLSRGTIWLDTGSISTLNESANYVRIIEERTGIKIACLEEIALANKWISFSELQELIFEMPDCSYKDYLLQLKNQ